VWATRTCVCTGLVAKSKKNTSSHSYRPLRIQFLRVDLKQVPENMQKLAFLSLASSVMHACAQSVHFCVETEDAELSGNNTATNDEFGYSVAMSGSTIVVGTLRNGDAGSAYVFERFSPGGWEQVVRLVPNDAQTGDLFGYAVAIDADTAIICSRLDDDNGLSSGSAYIFERDLDGPNMWGERTKITPLDPNATDGFGNAVDTSGDIVVVGSSNDDDAGSQSGSAYIFSRDELGANQWGQVAKLVASDAAAGDHFGFAVGISGTHAIVGAPDDADAGANSGAAYIFDRDMGGANAWGQVQKLVASDAALGDVFGISVAISSDFAIVGARGVFPAGGAYVFQRLPSGWTEVKKLVASDVGSFDSFGISVDISGDVIVIGARLDDNPVLGAGSVYVFRKNEQGINNWGEFKKIVASDAEFDQQFGSSVSNSGETVVIGAPRDTDNGTFSGSAYVASTERMCTLTPTTQPTEVPTGLPSSSPVLTPTSAPFSTLNPNGAMLIAQPVMLLPAMLWNWI